MKDVTGVLAVRGSCLVQKHKNWMYSTYTSICSDGDINPCMTNNILNGSLLRRTLLPQHSLASGMFSATVTCLYFRLTVDHCP